MGKRIKSSEPGAKSGSSSSKEAGGKFGFDTAEAKRLHAMGMRDVELAKQLGADRQKIAEWRKENGLPANRIVVWNEDVARELHKNGATDGEIAAELSKAGGKVSPQAVGSWRRKNNLDANSGYRWVRDQPPEKTEEPQAEQDTEARTPDIEGGTRRGHLVALPSKQPKQDPASRIPSGYAPRGMHQRKRNKAELPLPTSYDQGMGGMGLFPDFAELAPDGEGGFGEEDALYMFATILHLCRLDYGWDGDDVDEFLDAVAFAEQIMMSAETQTGTLAEEFDDHFDSDIFDNFFAALDEIALPKAATVKKKTKKNSRDTKKKPKK